MTEKITIEVVKPTSKIRNKSGEKNWKNPKRISFETPCIFLIEANIRREVAALDPATITRALLDVRVRAHKCIANNGWHLEG